MRSEGIKICCRTIGNKHGQEASKMVSGGPVWALLGPVSQACRHSRQKVGKKLLLLTPSHEEVTEMKNKFFLTVWPAGYVRLWTSIPDRSRGCQGSPICLQIPLPFSRIFTPTPAPLCLCRRMVYLPCMQRAGRAWGKLLPKSGQRRGISTPDKLASDMLTRHCLQNFPVKTSLYLLL